MQSLHFPVGFDQMQGLVGIEELDCEPFQVGPYTIRSTALNHPGGCAGFRIETQYGSIAYLPDHEPFAKPVVNRNGQGTNDQGRNELINFLTGIDLLILDTQYTEEEYRRHVGWGHGCLPDSVSLAADAAVRELALFHHDPSHRDYQIDLMIDAARNLPAAGVLKISGAAEMETIFLPQQLDNQSMPNGACAKAGSALPAPVR
jgi:phosphoribosyl 1,2-cyclic phosphodiesterase